MIRSRPCPASSWPDRTRASTASSPCSRRQPIDGPALVDADISANTRPSRHRSACSTRTVRSVLLGTLQVVPVGDSMLYFRPFYVESSRNPFPKLDYFIVVYAGSNGSKVALATP